MDFNNYYNSINTTYKHLNTVSEPLLIKKEISKSICDIIREKRTVGYNHTEITAYLRALFKNFFDPDNENTRSLYKNKIYITELRKNVISATERIMHGKHIIPAFHEESNKEYKNKQANTFKKLVKKSVYNVLNKKPKNGSKRKTKKV